MYSTIVDMSKDECRKALRTRELEVYGGLVDVLRAQGHFSPEKKKLLSETASALNIPLERHKAEIRRAVNDDILSTIAEMLVGPNTATEWAIEGRRQIPLLPRPPQQTILTALADESADYLSSDRDSYLSTAETIQKSADVAYTVEPSSPEPSKTHARSSSPSGLIVLPSGAAIQMKREEDDEMERKKRKLVQTDNLIQIQSPSSPPTAKPGQVQQIPMTSRTMPFPPGSTPLKIALPTTVTRTSTSTVQPFNSTPKQVIIVSSGSPNTPSILQKTLSVPMKSTGVKSTVMYATSPSPNTADNFKPRPKTMTSTPVAKPRSNAIMMSPKPQMKTAIAQGKVPMHAKIVLQQKQQARGGPKPQHVMVQKPGKQTVLTNVQLKTPQGFTSMPVQLRTGAKPSTVQLKPDGGQMKMLSISSGTKILPKPTQPLYVVTANTTSLTMVTRTVPASNPSRVMTVTTGSHGMKWSPSALGGKSLQTMHVMAQPRRHDGVVLLQKGKQLITQTAKDSPISKVPTKVAQKPNTSLPSNFATSIQQLPQSASGANVFLVDLGNQEKMTSNAMLADILQASGILGEGEAKAVTIDDAEDTDGNDKEEIKEEVTPVPSLSIEEAVEMLNRSDTPETRAILSQAGIQISDEIADSEEEEQILENSSADEQVIIGKSDDSDEITIKEELIEEIPVKVSASGTNTTLTRDSALPISTVSSMPSTVHSISTRPRLDIFSKALASANINLESFMEEEDDAEASTDDRKQTKEENADSSTDPLDLQLAALTGEMGH